MIKLKSLLKHNSSLIDEASEELYGIRKQPPDTCPWIDGIQKEARQINNKMYHYEKMDEFNLKDILRCVENFLYDNILSRESTLERVRDNVQDIRAWGQEWKDHAKHVDRRTPSTSNNTQPEK